MDSRRRFVVAVLAIAAIAVVVQLGAIAFATPEPGSSTVISQAQVIENPQNPLAAVAYVLYIVIGAGVILAIRKLNLVGALEYLTALLIWDIGTIMAMAALGLPQLAAAVLGLVIALSYMRWHPWYAVTGVAIVFGIFGAAVLGKNFGIVPALLLLALTALYDYVAVFRTEHMQSLADTLTSIDAPLPALLIIPTTLGAVGRDELAMTDDDVVSIGLGDFVIPATLTVSAAVYWPVGPLVDVAGVAMPLPALGTILGIIAGLVVVLWMLLRTERVLPGLPFINAGAVGGFLLAAGMVIA